MALHVMDFSLSSILTSLITMSVIAVFAAIFVDFIKYDRKSAVKKSKRSIVATGSMIGFYAVYYLVLRFEIGGLPVYNPYIEDNVINVAMVTEDTAIVLGLIGTSMIIAGAVINIVGRLQLKSNWANHIKIYEDQRLIVSGIYRLVRHPLYASIMLMLFGGSVAYRNWLSGAMTAFVFIPFMYYRAKQEETLLQEEFVKYVEYKGTTGMFFPKLWRQ